MCEIPYPPVFHDWRTHVDGRVTTGRAPSGIEVSTLIQPVGVRGAVWKTVELTEEDACLLAASLLDRAGERKLAQRVEKKLRKLREREISRAEQ